MAGKTRIMEPYGVVHSIGGRAVSQWVYNVYNYNVKKDMIEGSLEVKLPTIWTDEKQSREEAERRERLEERRVEEKE